MSWTYKECRGMEQLFNYKTNKFFEEVESIREVQPRMGSRAERKEKRRKALAIINLLTEEYGDVGDIPDSKTAYHQARKWLGVFDNNFMDTDVEQLRERVGNLARRHRIPQTAVYKLLAYYLDINMQTVKDKAYHNRFTVSEVRSLWPQLERLEQVVNLGLIVKKYEALEKEQALQRHRSIIEY